LFNPIFAWYNVEWWTLLLFHGFNTLYFSLSFASDFASYIASVIPYGTILP
jgi:hypothetical protein